MESRIILGIDPGLAITGYGCIRFEKGNITPLGYGCIRTESGLTDAERLVELERDMMQILNQFQPNILGIEKLLFTKNVTTGIPVGQARGIVLLCAQKAGLPIFEYTPTQVKLAVAGYGKADKAQVQDMVKRTLELDNIPKPDDAADALAIALCAMNERV